MRVEANLLSKNVSIDVLRWHDGRGNRGAAHTWYSSVPISYVYSYDTREQFTFESMAGQSTHDEQFTFGGMAGQ